LAQAHIFLSNYTAANMRDTIESINALLDSVMTSADFDKEVSRLAFLRECKDKGFENLFKSGLIARPEKKRTQYGPSSPERVAEMTAAVKRINELRSEGKLLDEALFEVDIALHTYTNWSQKLDMRFENNSPAECKQRVRQVNSYRAKGLTIKESCKRSGVRVPTYHSWAARYNIKFSK
jgi:hypothetical protein